VEVYFANIGWVEFEPTAGQPEVNRPPEDDSTVDEAPLVPVVPPASPDIFSIIQQHLSLAGFWSVLVLIVLAVILYFGEQVLLTYFPTARAMRWIYSGVYRLGRSVAGPADAGETPGEFATRLRAGLERRQTFSAALTELDFLTRLYLRSLYTPDAPQKDEIRQALRTWQKLRWRLLVARIMHKITQ
jgi:hypothetical protein